MVFRTVFGGPRPILATVVARAANFMLLLACLIIVLPQECVSSQLTPVRGIFALQKVGDLPDTDVLAMSWVQGISVRVAWREVETSRDSFDWTTIDTCLSAAKKANRKVMLRVLPGIHSPQWIYDLGIPSFEIDNPEKRSRSHSDRAPIPWNDRYLDLWISFLQKLAERYRDNDTLILLHMAGPTVYSAELHLPKQGDSGREIEQAGYEKQRLVRAWERVIDAYVNLFPSKQLSLNVAKPFRNDEAMENIVDYAVKTCGNRCCLQGNWLSGKTPDSFRPYVLIRDKRSQATVGFQMLGVSSNSRRMGSLDDALSNGLKAGARYFEIYIPDLPKLKNSHFLPLE